MKKKLSLRVLLLTFAFIIAASFMPFGAGADEVYAGSGTISMTTYSQVIKSGKTVYCAGAKGIYKVKLKNGKVKSKKCIFKYGEVFSADSYVGNMALVGKSIYFSEFTNGSVAYIYKVGTDGKGRKNLATQEDYADFVISGDKIYYETAVWDDDYDDPLVYTEVITLDGKYVGRSDLKIAIDSKKSNAKGYKMIIKKKGKYVKDYLKTPKGKFYLGKARIFE